MARLRQTTREAYVAITIDIPDLSERGMKVKANRVSKAVLLRHRQENMAPHFRSEAVSKYAPEYAPWVDKRNAARGGKNAQEYFARLRQESAAKASRGEEPTPRKTRSDRANTRPFYESGRFFRALVNNPARVSGKPPFRRLVVSSLPFYFKYLPNVFRAISAVNPAENHALAAYARKLWQKELAS